MKQILFLTSFLFCVSFGTYGQTVTVSPTTLSCGSNTVTFDYGSCGWTGNATVTFSYAGISAPNGGGVSVSNGVGTIVLDVASGTTGNFNLTITTSAIGNNPGGCMPTGPPPFSHIETMDADCAVSCSLTASAVVDQNESCAGANDGEATASGSGGSGNYDFEWDDNNSQTTATATGLAPGMYTVTVTDTSDGCTAEASITIAAASPCVTVSPTTLPCGQTTVTVDYGSCGWSGFTSLTSPAGFPSGVTDLNGGSMQVTNGIGTILFDVTTGTVVAFDLTITTSVVTNSGGGCISVGFVHTETMDADCAVSCSLTASAVCLLYTSPSPRDS